MVDPIWYLGSLDRWLHKSAIQRPVINDPKNPQVPIWIYHFQLCAEVKILKIQ